MDTHLTSSPDEAAEFIKSGGIAAFPTETVYGLGGDVFRPSAIAAIFAAKQRPSDNPLIVHVSDVSQIGGIAESISAHAEKLIETFFPGPLTVILPRSTAVPAEVSAGLDTIAVRQPKADIARRFLAACATPVAAPSANLSGRPSPTTWQAVAEDLSGRIDCILKGPPSEIGLESTVVDCTSNVPVLLRAGAISLPRLREVVPVEAVPEAQMDEPARSPGMRHRHYSPRARVLIAGDLFDPDEIAQAAYIGISRRAEPFALTRVCADRNEYAHALFEFFRECDRRDLKAIYCEPVDEQGVGLALMDRIHRAASG